jgi:phosphocarrier protein HPr
MMLAASQGTSIRLEAEGKDAEAALDALEELINNRFGEAE